MLDLYQELVALLDVLHERRVDYALCGGLALAVHGIPRATVDIDLLVPGESLDDVENAAGTLGFGLKAQPMFFAGDAVQMRRLTKVAEADHLSLDLVVVTPEIQDVWDGRQQVSWEHGAIWVVSRDGLVRLKSLRGSDQDKVDIKQMTEDDDAES